MSPARSGAVTADATWPGRRPVRLPEDARPILTVVVDTEESFDWGAPFDRASTDVGAVRNVGRLQAVCDAFGIRPTYVVDHPVAADPEAAGILRGLADAGRAEIGLHLHAWVSPPHEEEVNGRNSYQANLTPGLERRKLAALAERIERAFGRRPTIHKAGRYGFGPATAAILSDLGFEVDLSASPGFDFGADGGPDHSRLDAHPFWFGPDGDGGRRRLLELPTTGGFTGILGAALSPALFRLAAEGRLGRAARLRGILSRLGALDRMRLSPEGFGPADNRRLTRALLRRGVRTFTLSLHSPSLMPGCTPYARSEAEVAALLEGCRRYFAFFFEELGGEAMSVGELAGHLRGLDGLAGTAPAAGCRARPCGRI